MSFKGRNDISLTLGNICVTYWHMVTIREYIDLDGRSLYAKWFNRLNAPAAAKVAIAVVRMEQGNFSNSKGIGEGVFECRIDFGPGYRIYFGKDGDALVILLGGGTKKRQQNDIAKAKILWKEYKRRKRQER
jgi:putative addiction module killer protein